MFGIFEFANLLAAHAYTSTVRVAAAHTAPSPTPWQAAPAGLVRLANKWNLFSRNLFLGVCLGLPG